MKTLLFVVPILALAACGSRTADNYEYNSENGSGIPEVDQYGRVVGGYSNTSQSPAQPQAPVNGLGSIQGDPDRIVLSDYSQAQQKRDREAYAQRLDYIEANRVEVSSTRVPEVSTTTNVAAYARSTSNQLGRKRYNRSGSGGGCAFRSPDVAQRKFLEAGGPERDPHGLDRDGDGFACDFDPTPYRRLFY